MGLNIDNLRKNWKGQNKGFWTPDDGENNIRILPRSLAYFSEEEDSDFAFMFYQHYKISDSAPVLVCPTSAHIGKKCPICEKVRGLYKSNSEEDKELAKSLSRSKRFHFNIIDLDNIEAGVQVMETGPFIYKEIMKFVLDPDWGDLFDIKTGRNIVICKNPPSGGNQWASYEVKPKPAATNAKDNLPTTWKQDIAALMKKLPTAKEYDEINTLLDPTLPLQKAVAPIQNTSTNFDDDDDDDTNVHEVTDDDVAEVAAELEVEVAAKPKATTGGKPECFGNEYSPKDEKCKACATDIKGACRAAFLDVED